jgi:hypothetical protein
VVHLRLIQSLCWTSDHNADPKSRTEEERSSTCSTNHHYSLKELTFVHVSFFHLIRISHHHHHQLSPEHKDCIIFIIIHSELISQQNALSLSIAFLMCVCVRVANKK